MLQYQSNLKTVSFFETISVYNSERLAKDTCSWKGQLEKSKKLERFKLESLELERFRLSLKVPIEVGKFSMQY